MIITMKTASMETELSLLDDSGKQINHELWQSGRQLSEDLLVHVESLLADSKSNFDDLAGIIVFEGPGSFTSLRIGLTVANTMAYSLTLPIVGAAGGDLITLGLAKLAKAKPGVYVMPQYGAEANITRPKK